MRRIISALIILFAFTGCGISFPNIFDNSDNEERISIVDAPKIMFDKIISALDNKDSDELISLFSQNALSKISNIDEQIEILFELYQGKFVSNSSFDSGAGSGYKNKQGWIYLEICPRIQEIKTDEAVYSLSYNSVAVDDEYPNNVGLWGVWLRLKNGDEIVDECQVGTTALGRNE